MTTVEIVAINPGATSLGTLVTVAGRFGAVRAIVVGVAGQGCRGHQARLQRHVQPHDEKRRYD
jgi:hypothetical protein